MTFIEELISSSRFKSFAWRTGMMVLAYALSAVAANIGLLSFSPTTTTLLGLILGEVSKAINNSVSV